MHFEAFLEFNFTAFQSNDDNSKIVHIKVTLYIPSSDMAAEKSFIGCDSDSSQDNLAEVGRPHTQKIDIVLKGAINI